MKGQVSAQTVAVSCTADLPGSTQARVERTIQIDRQLGTYSDRATMTNPTWTSVTVRRGTCVKREGF